MGKYRTKKNPILRKRKSRTTYDEEIHPGIVKRYCILNNAIDIEIAKLLDITVQTFYKWQQRYSEFREAVLGGKVSTNQKLEETLIESALGGRKITTEVTGGKYGVITTKAELPPNMKAMDMAIHNRMPHKYRRSQEITGKDGAPLNDGIVTRVHFVIPDNGRDPDLRDQKDLVPASAVLLPGNGGTPE